MDRKEKKHEKHERSKRKRDRSDSSDADARKKPAVQISEDDYFNRAAEFRLYLQKKGKQVDSTKQARKLFGKFVKKWNRGDLDALFYEGITPAESRRAEAGTWNFKGVTKAELSRAVNEVQQMTESKPSGSERRATEGTKPERQTLPDANDEENRRDQRQRELKYKRRREKEEMEEVLNFVAPKETGREALMARKAAAQSKAKKDDDYDMEFGEKELLGEADSFKRVMLDEQRQKQRREQGKERQKEMRRTVGADKLQAHREKEKAVMDHFQLLAQERFGAKPS